MHGMIFFQLKKYVEKGFGPELWDAIVKEANLPKKIYLPIADYPDEEAIALITAASRLTGRDVQQLLQDFGFYLAATLLTMYKDLIKRHWKTLDLIEHTERNIHKVVRIRNPGAAPPRLTVERIAPNKVLLKYSSPRKMCSLAKGIALGVAHHYGEKIVIKDRRCMLLGDSICEIEISTKT